MDTIIKQLKDQVKNYISGKRYSHTLGVEKESCALAQLFGLNDEETGKLRISALLHDITKEKSKEEQTALCRKFNVEVPESALNAPKLFHAITGAELAKADFPDIVDEEIQDNIRYHTVGREGMKLSEKLLYLADYIEETRDFDDCIKLRRYFYKEKNLHGADLMLHLNRTLFISFDMTLRNLMDEHRPIAVETVKSRNYILKEISEHESPDHK